MANLLDEAIALGKQLDQRDRLIKELDEKIRAAEARLKETELAAEQAGRILRQQVRDETNKLLRQAEQTLKEAQGRLAEAMAKEKAVAWVQQAQEQLESGQRELAKAQRVAEQAHANATAQEHFYHEKIKTLTDWEDALAKQASDLSAKGVVPVVAEKPKGKGKK